MLNFNFTDFVLNSYTKISTAFSRLLMPDCCINVTNDSVTFLLLGSFSFPIQWSRYCLLLLFTLFDTNTFDLAIANYFATSVLLLVCLSDFKMDGVRIYTKKVIVRMW
jgi:hypothetical protein